MKANRMKVEPFHFVNILSYSGLKQANSHGSVLLSGLIRSEDREEYLSLLGQDTWVTVTVSDDEESRIVFCGIITDASLDQNGESSILSLELKNGTYRLEAVRHIRSFQKEALTYKDVIKNILKPYEKSNMIMTSSDQQCGFMLQYGESDWEFLKRVASCMNTVLIPDSVTGGVKFFCGVPNRGVAGEIHTKTYQVKKSLREYALKKKNGLSQLTEEDACCYVLKLRDIYDLGDEIVLNGMSMNVFKMYSELEGAELCHTYYLKSKRGFCVTKAYNESLTGVSLMGKVVGVQGTQIKVKLDKDENETGGGERWFDYSTSYSSQAGAGFYCMPEQGDTIRLYCPTRDEKTAYANSSVHRDVQKNPEVKTFMNKEGKQIILAPNYIRLTNNNGMTLELNDQSGIKVESQGAVSMSASDHIDISSKNGGITLSAKNKVLLKQGDTLLNLAGDISLKGAKVNIN